MKKSTLPQKMLLFFFLFTLITQFSSLNTLFSQVPQKFNYQAVARDGITLLTNHNINVQFDVLQGSSSGASVWQEVQNVSTNEQGLFSLEVGAVTTLNLDWADGPYFLNVKIDLQDGSGYKDFGNSELLAVPYALNAAAVSSLKNLEIIESVGFDPDSALFKVVNKDGNIVFAVYNEGVRVYVADLPTGKSSKGGFAIGGFTPGKGISNEYMRVTPDSVRVYVDETVSKGSRGGFAIGGFTPGKGPVTDFLHLSPDNYFIGHLAGSSITTGLYNSFFGYDAGVMNTEGNSNVFIGNETGFGNINGHWNIFVGNNSGYSNTSGSANIFMGDEAGISNTTGSANVFMGDLSGYSNTIGRSNVFIGADAGLSNDIGDFNVFLGTLSGNENTSGVGNVFLGQEAGQSNTIGNLNVAIGALSGYSAVGGNNNVFLGYGAGIDETGSNKLYIDNSGATSDQALMYGEFDNYYLRTYSDFWVEGFAWANETIITSDIKYKLNISSMDKSLDKILELQPVTYSWNKHEFPDKRFSEDRQIGLIAQDVEKVFPELVKENRKGNKGISYSKLTVVLLEAIQEQQEIIEELKSRIETLEKK